MITIEKYGEITLAKARKLAGDYKSEGKAGIDKIAEREKERQRKRDAKAEKPPTLQEWYDKRHKDMVTL